jgi:hypothetical protein
MKGWLDKYNDGGPVQPNYNDYSVSAGPGFEGDGTFNKGRNYSPAWGGQFADGGELQPIYVTDKKDPRLQAYKDSTILYNNYKKQYSAKGEKRSLTKEEAEDSKKTKENPRASFPDMKILNVKGSNKIKKYHYNDSSGAYNAELVDDMFHSVIKPTGEYVYKDPNFWNTNVNNIYKKPTQPVEYIDRLSQPQVNELPDLQPGSPVNISLPELKRQARPNRITMGKPLFPGGPQTDYYTPIDESGNVANSPDFTTRQFANGGFMPGTVGFMYERTGDIPDNGKYAKKTKASAQNGKEMQFYQEGLDWKPKTISKNGSELKKLDQLTNFTNYNPTQPSGWLEKYQ